MLDGQVLSLDFHIVCVMMPYVGSHITMILALDLYWSLVDSYSIQESESVLSKKEEEKVGKT